MNPKLTNAQRRLRALDMVEAWYFRRHYEATAVYWSAIEAGEHPCIAGAERRRAQMAVWDRRRKEIDAVFSQYPASED